MKPPLPLTRSWQPTDLSLAVRATLILTDPDYLAIRWFPSRLSRCGEMPYPSVRPGSPTGTVAGCPVNAFHRAGRSRSAATSARRCQAPLGAAWCRLSPSRRVAGSLPPGRSPRVPAPASYPRTTCTTPGCTPTGPSSGAASRPRTIRTATLSRGPDGCPFAGALTRTLSSRVRPIRPTQSATASSAHRVRADHPPRAVHCGPQRWPWTTNEAIATWDGPSTSGSPSGFRW